MWYKELIYTLLIENDCWKKYVSTAYEHVFDVYTKI